MNNKEKNDIISLLHELEKKKGFFKNVNQIDKYNIDAIIELIQYSNVKEYGDPLFSRREIRQGIKKYFTDESSFN
ncbi:hypothetical protein [Alkaliphilus peptidifermentans]|uniref:Uncharacterized protein n=1 Tax=Alkaliphilus peptidifermentans DSM 18978 TaxID=1120976 RepID=A0A1G5HT76_9FIRM|nr:hypothetical protein [Alkaliphilus peptidifermentans]SCY67082.1 hypothetical protein SAMN03080606_02131 [Alkaliphilus peptidifermentans DSM 18978]